MSRRARIGLLVALLIGAVAIWVLGGFLWPRPQFDQSGAPWVRDTLRNGT